jgi:large subunit ribosomal protein L22
MKAILRQIRISPKKANLVVGIVRGMSVSQALATLQYVPKKGARILYKVIKSAAYNAKNNSGQDLADLEITKIIVTAGPTLKRQRPVSRGRSHPILKRTANITVEVGVKAGIKPKAAPAKKAAVKVSTTKAPVKKEGAAPKKETVAKAPKAAAKTTTKKAAK